MCTREAKRMQEMKHVRQGDRDGENLREKCGGRGESKHIRERVKTCLKQWESKREEEGGVARERERDTEREVGTASHRKRDSKRQK